MLWDVVPNMGLGLAPTFKWAGEMLPLDVAAVEAGAREAGLLRRP